MKALRSKAIASAAVLLLSFGTASLLSSSAGASSTTTTVKAKPAKTKPVDLSGVTLNIGDISDQLQLPLTLSGQITSIGNGLFSVNGYPFKLNFTQFIAGPQAIAGIVGGSIDVAVTADTPAIFSASQGVKFKTIGVTIPNFPGADFSIVVPKGSTITSLSQLKGQTISAQTGTINEYFALQALKSVGLSSSDVTIDNLTPANAEAALSSGAVAAAVLPEPYVSALRAGGAGVLTAATGFIDGYGFLDAAQSSLNNAAKSVAIGDLLKLLGNDQKYAAANFKTYAQSIATAYNLPLPLATTLLTDSLGHFVTIGTPVYNATQAEANVFYANGELTTKVVAKNIFDTRYNSIVKPYVQS